jgi:hypothetical protein
LALSESANKPARTDCQKLDWKNHKILCPSFADPRPSVHHRRALLFPGGTVPPRFEWVKLYRHLVGGEMVEDFNSVPYLGTNDKDSNCTSSNGIQSRSIMSDVNEKIFWFKAISADGNPLLELANLGLRSFTRGDACWQDFKGPVFVMRATENEKRQLTHHDITMRDLRTAADLLSQTYRDGFHQEHLREVYALGTTVACTGRVMQGKPKWDEVVLNGADKVWNSDGSMIANLLGLPILVRSIHNPYEATAKPGFDNPEVTKLYLDVTSNCILPPVDAPPRGPQIVRLGDMEGIAMNERRFCAGVTGFGSSIQKFNISTTGTCYAVRADGKPLPKEHTQALSAYIAEKIEPQLAAATTGLSAGDKVPMRDEILASITKASFSEYFEAMKAKKVHQGVTNWRDLPSPYEIKHADMQSRLSQTLQAQEARGFEQDSDTIRRQEQVIAGHGSFSMADMGLLMQSLGLADHPY